MKTYKTTSTICFPEIGGNDINVRVEYYIDNDGIGSYEYWGQKCFDAGSDYVEVENIDPVFTDEPEERRAEIIEFIKTEFEKCAEQIIGKLELEYREREPEFEHERDE
jgi:hypothetical protein